MEQIKKTEMQLFSAKKITLTAMFISLTFIFTYFVNIRLPIPGNGGLIHLGNVPFFLAAMLYGKRMGAISGALGMGLFDILSGWAVWFPCTLITVGLMGFTIGAITEKQNTLFYQILSVFAALAIKIAGYYLYESFLYHNYVTPIGSIPGNIIQIITAGIVVLLLVKPLETILKRAVRS